MNFSKPYVLVAIIKKRLKLERPIYEILQILSISIFEKVPVNQLLMNTECIPSKMDGIRELFDKLEY